ncbi:FtsK/SpoIIIE domain-containing protein [Alloscardovia venturai]|uniref:FtsK/SpoIIIE domain-containing protein n=1 Tax=Alloscardovia venturai TaxID=1769421 RepID=A0ABW2Y1L8_9BIFI
MKGLVTVHNPSLGTRFSVYMDAADSSTLREVLPSFATIASVNQIDTYRLSIDGVVVDWDATVKQCGMHEGSWISFLTSDDIPFTPRPRVEGQPESVQLRFISGIHAGEVYDISHGIFSMSSLLTSDEFSMTADFMVDIDGDDITIYPHIDEESGKSQIGKASKRRKETKKKKSQKAARGKTQKKSHKNRPVEDIHSGIYIDGEEIIESAKVDFGDNIVLPECIVEITQGVLDEVPLDKKTQSGKWLFARPPKIHTYAESTKFTMPREPQKPTKAPIPFLSTLIPLAMSLAMAYFMKSPTYLMFGLMSPVMMVFSYISGNKNGNRRFKDESKKYKKDKQSVTEKAEAAVDKERRDAQREYPDPTQLMDLVVRHDNRLWNRRVTDKAWLGLRVGTGSVPSQVMIEQTSNVFEQERVKAWELHHHPVTVSIPQSRCLGVTGQIEIVRSLAQYFTVQLASLHSSRDLSLYILSPNLRADMGTQLDWGFAQWLPQTRPQFGQDTIRTIATTTQSIAARLSEITQLLDARQEDKRNSAQKEWMGSSIVIMMDNAHVIRTLPGSIRILQEGPEVGIYSVCIDTDERLLPEECQTVVTVEEATAFIKSNVSKDVHDIMPDIVSSNWVESVSLALAPIEDGTPDETASAIPASSNLLRLLKLTPTSEEILQRWNISPRNTRFVIGESVDGVFELDISKDGPHGLVGGTTGSGKSELLQSLVASLAVANTPDAMNFVLVDYKGGAAFKDCVNLPHTVGMVTDLDNHLVSRALTSLGAELNYREHILAQAGAKDIEDYIDMMKTQPSLKPMPRLLIVIDEFASLARELPDFVTGLVNIAQRGRSLGIHLLLATQRPGGVVSPEIRANTNLRIALRMTDATESQDVIDAKDAGLISKSTPGRAVVRLGSSSLVPFQSARVGGRYVSPDIAANTHKAAPLVVAVSHSNLGGSIPKRKKKDEHSTDVAVTDLKMLVSAISDATKQAGFAPQRQPWLPALSNQVDLAEIADIAAQSGENFSGENPPIPFGLGDFPDLQKQLVENINLSEFGNMFIVGTTRSGKSTALRTIAYSASQLYSAENLHIYCIDAGNGALTPLVALPNVGVVALRSETQKIERLLSKIDRVIKHRAQLLSSGGYSSIDEYNDDPTHAGDTIPHVLVLLDSWEGYSSALLSYDNGTLLDKVQLLMREGTSSGVHFVVSGDRQLLSGRMSMLADSKILLRLIEKMDYSVAGMHSKDVPDGIADGRGFRGEDGGELQIALINKGMIGQSESIYIREAGKQLAATRDATIPRSRMPLSVEEIPESITTQAVNAMIYGEKGIALGVGGEDNLPVMWDPAQVPILTIYGSRGSGKTTAAYAIATQAADAGYRVIVVSPRSNKLNSLEGLPHIERIVHSPAEMTDQFFAQYYGESSTDGEGNAVDAQASVSTNVSNYSFAQYGEGKTIIVMDDAHLLRNIPASVWLDARLSAWDTDKLALVVVGDVNDLPSGFGSWTVKLKALREGIVLKPDEVVYQELIGARFKRADTQSEKPHGRGFAHIGSVAVPFQMAYVDDEQEE